MTVRTWESPSPARAMDVLSLFTSAGTLICCALPTLLVLLGFGATVASVVSSVPFLVTLSRHKGWVFALAGVLLASAWAYRRWLAPRLVARHLGCALDDPRCRVADRASRWLFGISVVLYLVGVAVAYGLPVVLARMDA